MMEQKIFKLLHFNTKLSILKVIPSVLESDAVSAEEKIRAMRELKGKEDEAAGILMYAFPNKVNFLSYFFADLILNIFVIVGRMMMQNLNLLHIWNYHNVQSSRGNSQSLKQYGKSISK